MRRRLVLAACALAILVPAPAAPAQEPGVHVDPGSPAGKEYAIPIERARREAAGGSGISTAGQTPAQAAAAVPIFGQGIKPEKPKKKARKKKNAPRRQTPTAPAEGGVASAAAVQAALQSPSTAGATGGIVAAVVLGGGLLALALRRRRA